MHVVQSTVILNAPHSEARIMLLVSGETST